MRLAEVHSAILLKHLASNFLSPNGYVCFNGDMKVFQEKTSFNEPLLQQVSKCAIQKLGLDLATDRMDEELIYDNACVNILLHEPLITDRDRKVPNELKIYNRKLSSIAQLLKYWASGDGRPENGAVVGFDFSQYKNGSVCLPKYF